MLLERTDQGGASQHATTGAPRLISGFDGPNAADHEGEGAGSRDASAADAVMPAEAHPGSPSSPIDCAQDVEALYDACQRLDAYDPAAWS